MSLTVAQARDEMMLLLNTAWVAAYPTYPLLFEDAVVPTPDTSEGWGRAMAHHVTSRQSTLGDSTRMFTRTGIVTVDIFTKAGKGLSTSDAIVNVCMTAFEGKSTPGGVWFRNVRVNEVGTEGDWYHAVVLADFEYYQLK